MIFPILLLALQVQEPAEIASTRQKLKDMVEMDQAARSEKKIEWSRLMELDAKHLPELERIFQHYGWPKRSVFGKEAGHDFWLLVQHQQLEFQQRVLPALERPVSEGEGEKSDYAYVFDRVRSGRASRSTGARRLHACRASRCWTRWTTCRDWSRVGGNSASRP